MTVESFCSFLYSLIVEYSVGLGTVAEQFTGVTY
jgi:hypothetical protein